jgi:hypothetical protein
MSAAKAVEDCAPEISMQYQALAIAVPCVVSDVVCVLEKTSLNI